MPIILRFQFETVNLSENMNDAPFDCRIKLKIDIVFNICVSMEHRCRS